MMTRQRLQDLLERFSSLTIGLLGDLFLDRYLNVAVESEISIETGLEAYQVTAVRNVPGALGTVMNNLAALGVGRLKPVTVIGDDGHGFDLLRSLTALPLDPAEVLRTPERLTPTYTKPMRERVDQPAVELNRLDVRSREPVSRDVEQQIEERLRAEFARCDGWIVLDQIPEANCGVVTSAIRAVLADLTRSWPEKLVLVDSRKQLDQFCCGTLKGNRAELLTAVGMAENVELEQVRSAALRLAQRTGRSCYCTLGEQGILIARCDGTSDIVPGFPAPGPIDIVGAGDSATSGLALALLAGASDVEAATVANLVASITVQQLGTTGVAYPHDVLTRWSEVSWAGR